ncbi:MAG: MFS transporter [Candidatus ainarchaeum sp.]|nr:MFS transporter [Candidatus ainarchaeum sp.]
MTLEKNMPITYIYSILMKRVTMPIIIIYFLFNNLNYSEIALLASISAIIGLIFEIPAGAITDKYGKKTMMILIGICSFFMMFFYFIGTGLFEFIIASIFLGLWIAFESGTRDALLYDTLIELKRKDEYKKIYGKMILYSHIGNALILLPIPLLYSIDIKLPFLIGIVFSILTIVFGFLIQEPKIETEKDHKYISSSIKEILTNKTIIFMLILMMISFASIFAYSEFKQPLLVISGIEIIYFGVIYAIIRSLSGIGGILPHKLHNSTLKKYTFCFGIILLIISFIFSSSNIGHIIIFGILIISLTEGILRVSFYDKLNSKISSQNRTTILSITSVLQQLYKAVFVLIMGFLADFIGLTQMFFPATIILIIAIGLTFIIFKNQVSTIFT